MRLLIRTIALWLTVSVVILGLYYLVVVVFGFRTSEQAQYALYEENMKDPNPERRASGVRVIPSWEWNSVAHCYVLESLQDKNQMVRVEAAMMLAEMDPSQNAVAVAVLASAVEDGPDPGEGTKAVVLAIRRLENFGASAKPAIPILRKHLEKLLRDDSASFEPVYTAAALARIDASTHDIAIPVLARALKGRQESVIAAETFCKLGAAGKDHLPEVRKLLKSDDTFVSESVAHALEKAGHK